MGSPPNRRLVRQMLAEFIGTFLLIFFGLGAVHAAVLTGAQSGVWQIAIIWGIAIMLAIYCVAGVSGAHINPAMTLSMACWRKFPGRLVVPYVVAQLLGSIAAASVLYFLFTGYLINKESTKQVVRGQAGSIVTAMCYGEYFPAPAQLANGDDAFSTEDFIQHKKLVTHQVAFVAEMLGTMILAFVVFAVSDDRNNERPPAGNAAIFIGLTVSALISVLAPLTQACFNPARDFGPRMFAFAAGWGQTAFPGIADISWLTVYIIAPCVGAVIGGGVYDLIIRPGLIPAKKMLTKL